MKTIANILWIIFGGLELSIFWALAGLVLCLSIVGIPFGLQCFKFAGLMLSPFGKQVVYSCGTPSFIFNIFWIIFFGWELAFCSVFVAALWCMTIVGIPVGVQVFKFAKLSFMPFGAKVV